MAIRYIASTGSNTAPYDTWASAATAPLTVTALMAAGDISYIKNEVFTIAADTTYTIAGTYANPGLLISTSDTTNNPPLSVAVGAKIDGSATSAVDILITGKAYIYGVEFKCGGSTGVASITLGSGAAEMFICEECIFNVPNNNNSGLINIGPYNSTSNNYVKTIRCTFYTANATGAGIGPYAQWEDIGSIFSITTAIPTIYFKAGFGTKMTFHGSNFNAVTTTLFAGTSEKSTEVNLIQCSKAAGVAVLAAQTGPNDYEVFEYDCASGDTHYEFGHYNYWGNTTISTAIYMSGTDGASYNAANAKHSWKITGVNGTYASPYVSPWISVYNEAVAAVTPRLEILRDGVTTAYNDDQVWGEFSAKVTLNSTIATVVRDRRGLVAAAAVQAASALGAADWAGETTPWYGKLEPTATITPAEIGDIAARVCVAGANTVYLNPKILGI